MSKKQIILVGGGGHCKSLIEAIKSNEHIDIIGILDSKNIHSKVSGIPVIGDDSIINDLINQHYQFVIAVGNIGKPDLRRKLFENILSLRGTLTSVISTNAIVAESCVIGAGSVVMQKALVNTGVVIGHNCIINTNALIEHETIIGNHVHISTGAVINGQCKIGNNCFIGSGSIVANNVTIADNVIIGAGSVILKDILNEGTYFGNPAQLRNKN